MYIPFFIHSQQIKSRRPTPLFCPETLKALPLITVTVPVYAVALRNTASFNKDDRNDTRRRRDFESESFQWSVLMTECTDTLPALQFSRRLCSQCRPSPHCSYYTTTTWVLTDLHSTSLCAGCEELQKKIVCID